MPTSDMILSVVLPNYNHARFLDASLGALLGQTRRPDEIIVIDDCSTDDSVAVIERCSARDPRMRLIRNPENLGVVQNLNRGLGIARGQYVYFAAADDMAGETLFAEALELLEAHPEAALFSARCRIIEEDGTDAGVLATPVPLSAPGLLPPARVGAELMRHDGWFNGSSTIYRRSALAEAGGFPTALGAFTDGYVCRKLALMHGACFSPRVLSSWRRLEGGYAWSITRMEATRHMIETVTREMEKEGGLFPPGYADLWARRYLFGVKRFVLSQTTKLAARQGTLAWLKASVTEAALTAWFFASLRPGDLFTAGQRRLSSRLGF
jgi:glycosyltransferase involved in cell wall biosynthesis